MRFSMTTRRLFVAAAVAVCAPGCGSGGSTASTATTVEHLSIEEIARIFQAYKKGKKPPPQGIKDFLPYEQGYSSAIDSLKKKEVVVFWGNGLSDGPEAATTVLAYRKDVPEKGGEVLMQDGTAKTMTAAEFNAASKPMASASAPAGAIKKK